MKRDICNQQLEDLRHEPPAGTGMYVSRCLGKGMVRFESEGRGDKAGRYSKTQDFLCTKDENGKAQDFRTREESSWDDAAHQACRP